MGSLEVRLVTRHARQWAVLRYLESALVAGE
jgi:hypothetical protein